MRTIATIVLFAAASLSTASAQDPAPQSSWAMDHGHAADAAAKAAAADARAKAAAVAAGLPVSPSESATFTVNGDSVIDAEPPLTPEQKKAEEEKRATWQARCRPTVIEDRDGLRRTQYAEPDCDLSRFNTAGQ